MNKFTKGVLITAGCFFAGGVILGITGAVGRVYTGEAADIGEDFGIVRDTWYKVRGWDLRWRRGGASRGLILEYDGIDYDEDYEIVYGSFTDDSLRGEDIRHLDVEIGDGKLTIRQGDGLELKKEGGPECQYYVEGDTFYLKQKSPLGGGRAELTLTLPEGVELEDVDISMAAGAVVTKDLLTAREIEIEVSAGEITMEKVQTDFFNAKVAAGSVVVNRLDAEEVHAEVSMGNIKLQDSLVAGSLDAEVSMGEIDISLRDSYENHDYNVDCGMGNISISPEDGALKEFAGLGHAMDILGGNSGGDSVYILQCSMGNITVRFEGKNSSGKGLTAADSAEDGKEQIEEDFQKKEKEAEIKGAIYGIEDYWPEKVGRESENTTAENFTFELEIEEPMILVVACETMAGELDLEIESGKGREIFKKHHIRTGNYEVMVDQAGTYTVRFDCENHTGSFWIYPKR